MGYSSAQAKAFISAIAPLVQKYAKEFGYKVASPIIAQAICESAAGTSGLSAKYHNYYGLKAGSQKKGSIGVWDGTVVKLSTKEEYKPGTLTTIKDCFRVYSNMEEGVKGYFEFLMYNRYQNLKTAKTPSEFLTLIMKDGYCTSTTYHTTCMGIINKYDLTKYDSSATVTVKPSTDSTKNLDQVVQDVLNGKYGNGETRKTKLKAAGYDPVEIQNRVNKLLKK